MTVVGNGIVLGATVSAGVAVSTTSVSEPEHPANTQIKLITSSRRFMLDIHTTSVQEILWLTRQSQHSGVGVGGPD